MQKIDKHNKSIDSTDMGVKKQQKEIMNQSIPQTKKNKNGTGEL